MDIVAGISTIMSLWDLLYECHTAQRTTTDLKDVVGISVKLISRPLWQTLQSYMAAQG